ncbi:MAG TPA: SGNH/GDSL hydrolase family protein [Candidatus Acidoferrales bacterium]|nr:SGNH/GDSL hydrolase family protein [Candidatus Acidoferrales bacterium]
MSSVRTPTRTFRYLALGDSYTIGTGASGPAQSFPSRLARRLERGTRVRVEVTNPAVNGFTTEDLIRRELPLLEKLRPDLVTILIGANDVVQGRSEAAYRASLVRIYDAVADLRLPAGRVWCISVPDWSAAPAAAGFGAPAQIRRRLSQVNAIAREEADRRGFGWVDLFELSRTGLDTPGWVAGDGLHPGDRQYLAWADHIWRDLGPAWKAA